MTTDAIRLPELDDPPPSPAEYRAHIAFYNLTVAQRDRAWRRIEDLGAALKKIREADEEQFGDDYEAEIDAALRSVGY